VDTLSYRTVSANKATVQKNWVVVDAKGQVLGRVASEIARLLRGKHKTNFTPHADCGDFVVVINAAEVVMTGSKMTDKQYVRYTGYPGGQRFASPTEILAKHPIRLVEMAVRGMLPKNRLGRAIFRNLYVYPGAKHPHEAQQPTEIKLA